MSTRFDVAATPSGYAILIDDDEGIGSYLLNADGLGPRVDVPLADTDRPLAIASSGDTLVATASSSGGFDGLPIAHSTGGAWTTDRDLDAAQGSQIPGPQAVAIDGAGNAAVVWVEGFSEQQLLFAWWTADGWGEYGEIDHNLQELARAEMHATFDASGTLYVTFLADDAAGFGLFVVTHPAGGDWSVPRRLGSAEGSLANIVVSAVVSNASGTWTPIVAPADFRSETDGGLSVYPVTGGAALTGPRDDRPVVEGLAAAVLGDGRIVASASWGENNFDADASDDEVLLYLCGATSCKEGAVIDGTKGTFYGATRIAAKGNGGVVIYHAEPKLDGGPERTMAQRFLCD